MDKPLLSPSKNGPLLTAEDPWDGVPIVTADDTHDTQQPHSRSIRPKHYRHLDSIEWAHEYARNNVVKSNADIQSRFGRQIRQSARWIVLVGTGLLIGVLTSTLDYSYKWLTDVKDGVCSEGVWKTKALCCDSLTEIGEGTLCEQWSTWDEMIGLEEYAARSFLYRYFVFIFTSLVIAAAAAYVSKGGAYVRTSGIAEIKSIISGLVIDDFLSDKTMLKKLFGLALAVSANLWVGKEGPLVHIACCCAEMLIKLFPILDQNEAKRRELLVPATAAGIAVAFNAPISGVIFTLEQLTSYFHPSDKMWTSFVCAMISTVVLNTFKEGINVYVTMHNQWLSMEMFGFVFLGVCGGLYGAVFNKLNLRFAHWRKQNITPKGPKYEVLEVLALTLVTALVCYPLVFPRMPLTSLLGRLYMDCEQVDDDTIGGLCALHSGYAISLLLTAGVVASILTAYTFGTIVPAGVLTPSLAIGAIFGRALGMFIEDIQDSTPFLSNLCDVTPELCISPGAYAVVGSAAFLAGTTKMTVWVVVTVFELTGALSYVLPIMITVIVARWTNDKYDKLNCYDQWIKFFGYPYLIEVNQPLPLTKAEELMKPVDEIDALYLDDRMTVNDLEAKLDQLPYQGLPILESRQSPRLFGWVCVADLQDEYVKIHASAHYDGERPVDFGHYAHGETDVYSLAHLVETDHIVMNPSLPLPSLVEVFFKMKPRVVLFRHNGLFAGLMTLNDITRIVESFN